jgi:hypothetical protein
MELNFNLLAQEAYQDPGNYIPAEKAISEDLVGMRLYDVPIFGVADALDPMFEEMRRPGAIGPHFLLPEEWLPGAKRVISFFLPSSTK